MANKPTIMLKLKRVIQLKLNGKSKSEISRNIPIHRTILDKYLKLIDSSGKSYLELLALEDEALIIILSKDSKCFVDERLADLKEKIPDFIIELKKTGVTQKLLWLEYIEQNPEGYCYAQFCTHFTEFRKHLSATMHFDHLAGEQLEVDFAGSKLSYIDIQTGEVILCTVLVCVLPYSRYTYVEALLDATQENLFLALNRCLHFMGGVPRNIKSDNMRQFITKNSRYEFTFPQMAEQWSLHYNTSLAATRPRKPKDKPTVENSVYHSYLRIFAPLRNQHFFSLESLNEGIMTELNKHNCTPFQKKPGSRKELFLLHEKATLSPLPKTEFTIKHSVSAKVQKNYHVILGEDNHQYSVPYTYIGKQAQVIYDRCEVEIFIDLKRIALHKRNMKNLGYTTLGIHMPINHQKHAEARGWDTNFFIGYAQSIGPNAIQFFSKLMSNRAFVEQTYKACLGVKRLGISYGNERLEAACGLALLSKISYGSLKNILELNLDKKPVPDSEELYPKIEHENTRGAHAYK